jgi:nucleoside-diphosphate-sugar epimerase
LYEPCGHVVDRGGDVNRPAQEHERVWAMRVLVTGHQGYLGTVMVPILQAAGHDVTGLDSGFFAECVLGAAPQDPPGVQVDLRDVTSEQLNGFEAVIHLAALSNDPLGALAPQITYDINHHASVRLARLAKEAGVRRFLYASTCSVYGAAGTDLVTESAPLRPMTPYAESKVRVEDDVAAIADESFSPVFLRNATAFGFSPRLRADIVLNNLVGHAVLTGDVRVLSDGTPWRPLVHARDIATAFLVALEAPTHKVHCAAYNVGAESNNLTVAEIAQSVVDAVPGAKLLITGETGSDPRSYKVDFSAFRHALGFEAAWSIPDGAAELYENYISAGLTDDDFAKKFTRLAQLEALRTAGVLDESMRRITTDA